VALPVLEIPITEIDISLGDLHYNDNLVYHYAGGMAFAALKKWEEAEEFFEICVSSPAQVPAAIQLEAYKKLTLVQLISRGTVSLSLFATWSSANRPNKRLQQFQNTPIVL
jgi:COP9 signalosome complex subunit 3